MPRRRYGFGPPRRGLGGAPGAVDIFNDFFEAPFVCELGPRRRKPCVFDDVMRNDETSLLRRSSLNVFRHALEI